MNPFSKWTQADVQAYNAKSLGIDLAKSQTPSDAAEIESDLHYEIIKECKARGWLYFHGSMAHATRRSIGEPDFTVLSNKGRVFFIECKARNGKMSPAQMGVALQADILGHKVHIVSSITQFLSIVEP